MTVINKWDYAPEGATHYAVDADGSGWWYDAPPEFLGAGWRPTGKMMIPDHDYQAALSPHSLEARPAPITADPPEPVAIQNKADRDMPEEK